LRGKHARLGGVLEGRYDLREAPGGIGLLELALLKLLAVLVQRATVHVLEFTSHWDALCQSRYTDVSGSQHLGNEVCRRLTFHGAADRKDDLFNTGIASSLKQIYTQFLRSYPVDRREITHEHKV